MEDFYYKSTTKQNNTEYYNMEDREYRRLTNHIIGFMAVLLERGIVNGKREKYSNVTERLEILREDRYSNKSTLHNEPISMLDALCGIVTKVNRRSNNDLTNRQIDMFNRIVQDFSTQTLQDPNALDGELINMIKVSDTVDQKVDTFNRLFN